jgi:methionine synthase I (cobalamin-dependent)
MTDHLRTLSEMASTRVSCYPNAGLPDEEESIWKRRSRSPRSWSASSSTAG